MKLIVAVDLDDGIGKNNMIPWYYPEDFRFFKKITCQTFLPDKRNAIIMGRMTWQSLSKVEQDTQIETKWIIGGAEIYQQAFDKPELTDVYLTRIKDNYNCDKKINLPNMKLINCTDYEKYAMNHYKII